MKAAIPATIPASIVRAKAGLAAISAKIVSPAGTDLYNESANDEPMINRIGIAMINPTDHRPNVVVGTIVQGCLIMLSAYPVRRQRLLDGSGQKTVATSHRHYTAEGRFDPAF